MKSVYIQEIELHSSKRFDSIETICVVDANGESEFYYAVINPMFRIFDTDGYVYLFDKASKLVDFFVEHENAEGEHTNPLIRFQTKQDYFKWYNNLQWL